MADEWPPDGWIGTAAYLLLPRLQSRVVRLTLDKQPSGLLFQLSSDVFQLRADVTQL